MHLKIRVSILIVVLLVTSLALISCGAFEDDNNQPAIEPITDQMLDVGNKTTVYVNITDADIDDTHILLAHLLRMGALRLSPLMQQQSLPLQVKWTGQCNSNAGNE